MVASAAARLACTLRGDGAVVPVETLSSHRALGGSRAVWQGRHEVATALTGSEAMRAAARIGGYDAWDVIAPELRGIATLQFPWSARAMDEAGAAIERARPRLVLTYAEAGGWGAPSCSRRGAAAFRVPASSTATSTAAGSTTCMPLASLSRDTQ